MFTKLNVPSRGEPRRLILVMIATEIPAAIRPYSIAFACYLCLFFQVLIDLYLEHLLGAGQKTNSTSGMHAFALGTKAIEQIISMAASRAGIRKFVTPHWLRHVHIITHSLDRRASMATVSETVGRSSYL